jgi:hypothetical protein
MDESLTSVLGLETIMKVIKGDAIFLAQLRDRPRRIELRRLHRPEGRSVRHQSTRWNQKNGSVIISAPD